MVMALEMRVIPSLDSNESECNHPMNDVDEDGYPNDTDICPWNHDPDQLDQDGDGKGDACDQCPDYATQGRWDANIPSQKLRPIASKPSSRRVTCSNQQCGCDGQQSRERIFCTRSKRQ